MQDGGVRDGRDGKRADSLRSLGWGADVQPTTPRNLGEVK